MKKIISISIIFAILMSLFSVGAALPADAMVSGDFKYTINDNGATITKYTGSGESVEVPAQLDGVNVTAIGDKAFKNNKTVASVKLPETITEIGEEAFYLCEKLTDVNIPQSVTKIGRSAFANSGLKSFIIPPNMTEISDFMLGHTQITEISIPENIKSIGSMAFCGTKLKEVTIPETVDKMEEYGIFMDCPQLKTVTVQTPLKKIPFSFCSDCKKLEKVVLPETVTKIDMYAFNDCKKLKSITIPETLEEIKSGAFFGSGIEAFRVGKNVTNIGGLIGATKLSKLTVDKDNAKYTLKGGVLYNKEITKLVFCPSALDRKIFKVPDTVKTIKSGALTYNKTFEEVKLNKVKKIGGSNFRYSVIKKLVVPKSVEFIDDGCFFECNKLEKIVFKRKKSITVWDYCFMNCKALKYAEFPVFKSEYCGTGMYDDCPALKTVKVIDGVKDVPWIAYGSKALKTVIIPKSATKINSSLGWWCYYTKKNGEPLKKKRNGFTIKGKKNSAAQKYADKNGFKFVAV